MHLQRRHFLTLAASAALAGPVRAAGKLKLVATTGMIADTARQIGGDLVEVQALMGPGVDPHSYRQTRSDIVTLTRADVVLRHGLYLEAQMEDLFDKLSRRVSMHAVGVAVPPEQLIAHPNYADKKDPHVWMVPTLWTHVVRQIAGAIIAKLPNAQDQIEASTVAYLTQMQALQSYAETTLATVPEPARVLLTAHDAFGYFGRSFGYEVIGIQGISTESEAGLNRIAELVDLLVTRKITATFVETSVSDRNIRALIEGAAARGHMVQIGGELFSDAMGPDGSYEGTYIGMIDHNVTTIARALGGTAPDRGLNGRLAAGS
ncbi:zinc ABC transporter substrate-binding protein [Alisedimentitalea sp. MJ-SS2]|uniref:metal ABC transporter solute-binding protein, Zn/Mn family n=1 Tax=Aliisedimentitalea sp. MJ-SS2 TaxID=3049795 RepID=UPI00290A07A2|nr:zinc ABC transporter substrate-binding protein [Alisedimentitalea sp. MJ-SS2]MDU8928034.1 zinc ABC transporter substrate-binding protein [Alisedimentitalea sp. MJ-SS2]